MPRATNLTPKQRRFTEEYLVDLNATQAAIRAGYSQKTAGKIGFQLLEKTRIQHALQAAREQISERTNVTVDWVVQRLVLVCERCLQAEPVRDRLGTVMEGTYGFNAAGANKSLELLGRRLGMFVDKVAPTSPDGTQPYHSHAYEELSSEELREFLAALKARGTP